MDSVSVKFESHTFSSRMLRIYSNFVLQGITNLENRKEWPLTTLRAVLQELIDETPADLLARYTKLQNGKKLKLNLTSMVYDGPFSNCLRGTSFKSNRKFKPPREKKSGFDPGQFI